MTITDTTARETALVDAWRAARSVRDPESRTYLDGLLRHMAALASEIRAGLHLAADDGGVALESVADADFDMTARVLALRADVVASGDLWMSQAEATDVEDERREFATRRTFDPLYAITESDLNRIRADERARGRAEAKAARETSTV